MLKKWSFFTNSGLSFHQLSILYTLKFILGISVFYIYTYYYTDRKTADVFKYFDDAKYLYEHVYTSNRIKFWKIIFGIQNETTEIHNYLIETNYWFKPHSTNVFNDNRTVIRFNAVIYLFSFGYYHVHTLVLSTLSFIGLTGIYRTFLLFFHTNKKELIYSCYLIPSVLFWGSGILKESILLFGIGIFIFSFSQFLYISRKTKFILLIIITLGLLAITKTYVLIVLFPSVLAWLVVYFFQIKRIGWTYFFVNMGLITVAFNAKHIHSSLDFTGNLVYKQKDFINVARDTKAGSTIKLGIIDNSAWSYIKNCPEALINAMFRPTLFEVKNVLFALVSVENTLLFLLLILLFFFFKKPKIFQLNLIYFGIYFTILLAILIGLTVPVLGAIVRYKTPFMPFIISILLVCIDFAKIKSKFVQQ